MPINSGDINKLLEFVKKEKIGLTIVGPETHLCKGIVDIFEKEMAAKVEEKAGKLKDQI